jgi:hypothetical protein
MVNSSSADLAAAWVHLTRTAEDPGLSAADKKVLVERADAVLDELAAAPENTEVSLAAEILFREIRTRWLAPTVVVAG